MVRKWGSSEQEAGQIVASPCLLVLPSKSFTKKIPTAIKDLKEKTSCKKSAEATLCENVQIPDEQEVKVQMQVKV